MRPMTPDEVLEILRAHHAILADCDEAEELDVSYDTGVSVVAKSTRPGNYLALSVVSIVGHAIGGMR